MLTHVKSSMDKRLGSSRLMAQEPRGWWSRRTLWIAGAIAILSIVYVTRIAHRMPDFQVYQRAGVRARAAAPLYRAEDGHYQFKYLPAFAIAAVPVGSLPDPVARSVWFAASVALLALLLWMTLAILPDRRWAGTLLVASTVVLLAKFYAHELELGQVNILMTALVVAAAQRMRAGSESVAGFLIAAAVVVKPYAVLFVPYLIARRRLLSVLAAVGGLLAALLLPALVYGFTGNLTLLAEWWSTVRGTTAPNLIDFNNVSAASVFTRLLGSGRLAELLAWLMTIVLLITAAFVFARRRAIVFPEGLEIGLLLTMLPIISPQGWDYVFLVSTPAVMYLVNYSETLPRHLRTAVIGALLIIAFSLFDLLGRAAYRVFMSWSMITWCYLVVIAGLVTLRVRRVA
jgi:hypothetical protein